MSNAPFTVTVAPHAEVHLIGLRIATDMQKCAKDCPAVWQRFMPLAENLLCRTADPVEPQQETCLGESFGLSFLTDPASGAFDYAAAVPAKPNMETHSGLEFFTLPAGLYAFTQLSGLAQIGDAYHYLYSVWLPGQNNHAPNPAAPCFEHYDRRFLQTGELEIAIPVSAR